MKQAVAAGAAAHVNHGAHRSDTKRHHLQHCHPRLRDRPAVTAGAGAHVNHERAAVTPDFISYNATISAYEESSVAAAAQPRAPLALAQTGLVAGATPVSRAAPTTRSRFHGTDDQLKMTTTNIILNSDIGG